jgi:hypothetical protein
MSRVTGWALVFLMTHLLACGGSNDLSSSLRGGGVTIGFREILPADWRLAREPYEIETGRDDNGDGRPDKLWVVFYRFDIPCEGPSPCSPINAVVYRLNSRRPPCLIPYDLHLPQDAYLCECDCSMGRAELIPPAGEAPPGEPELLIWDRCDGESRRLSIFQWITSTQVTPSQIYANVGHFVGDRVSLDREKDQVTVDRRLPPEHPLARSQLAFREVYRLRPDGQGGWGWSLLGRDLVCYCGMPCDATLSPYPEKVVLAFYSHYPDTVGMREYFTEAGWERVGGCWNDRCGCTMERDRVTQVRVLDLQELPGAEVEGEGEESCPTHLCENQGANSATVLATVVCEPQCCGEEHSVQVLWHLVRRENRRLLDGAEVLPSLEEGGPAAEGVPLPEEPLSPAEMPPPVETVSP